MYRRASLMRPILGRGSTLLIRILTFGTASDFIVSIKITKSNLTRYLLALFENQRRNVYFAGAYRRKVTHPGRQPQLHSIDLLSLA